MKKHGFFLTFEGGDGVGKTTQIRLLEKWLNSLGYEVAVTREPGGIASAEEVRRLLLHTTFSWQPLSELFLYETARAEHMAAVIRPALQKGAIVLCDRFTDATLAYQGYARGLSLKDIHTLNKMACGNRFPDLTILLDQPANTSFNKALQRHTNGTGDRMEQEGLDFQKKVRSGYLALARNFSQRIKIIKLQPTIEATHKKIKALLKPYLNRYENLGSK